MDADPAREAAILTRCEAATPGPWDHKIPTDGATHELTRCVWAKALGIPVAQSLAHHDFPEDEGFIQEQALANAHFIAHAREDVPWLLAQLAAARARAERAEGALERIRDGAGSNTIALSDVQDERAHTWGGVYRIATSVVGERVIHADTDIARALAARGE